jgi:transposase
MKEAKDPKQFQRWQIVYAALIQPRKAEEITKSLGVSKSLIQKIIPLYNREGPEAMEIKKSGGRYHEYLTVEEEKKFLAPFFDLAAEGKLTTTKPIHLAYEERIGRKVPESTISRQISAAQVAGSGTSPISPKSKRRSIGGL